MNADPRPLTITDLLTMKAAGKPVVMLWGLGFKDRPWTPGQGEELIRFFISETRKSPA